MLRASRSVRCGVHAICQDNYFITQWNKSPSKWLTRGLPTAPTEVVVEEAGLVTAAGAGGDGRTSKSNGNQEVRPFTAIPGPKPLPLLGNKLFFPTIGKALID